MVSVLDSHAEIPENLASNLAACIHIFTFYELNTVYCTEASNEPKKVPAGMVRKNE